MEKIIKIISIIILVISVLLLPVFGIYILFGLAGDSSKYFILMSLGYIGVIISAILSIFKYKFFPVIIISILLIIIGGTLDNMFWNDVDANLCKELRAEPSCIEDECGFQCSDFPSGSESGFTTGGGICKDKDMSLCIDKTK
ncbi:MAG: hypothetical protein AABX88_02700 [Nanoarchaeota archaeon]